MTAPPSKIPVFEAVLERREESGGGLVLASLSVDAATRASYALPGQYVFLRHGTETGYFVLANSIDAPAWELLVRPDGGAADAIVRSPMGTPLAISAALGPGFPCEVARGRPLMMAVAGTGIAAARPVLAWRLRDGDASETRLLVGVRNLSELPLTDALREWASLGVDVTVCFSRDGAEVGGNVRSARGYVQDVAGKELRGSLQGGRLFAVGPEAMLEALRDLSTSLGIRESDVVTNY